MINWIFICRNFLKNKRFKKLTQQCICPDIMTKHSSLFCKLTLHTTYEYSYTFHPYALTMYIYMRFVPYSSMPRWRVSRRFWSSGLFSTIFWYFSCGV